MIPYWFGRSKSKIRSRMGYFTSSKYKRSGCRNRELYVKVGSKNGLYLQSQTRSKYMALCMSQSSKPRMETIQFNFDNYVDIV